MPGLQELGRLVGVGMLLGGPLTLLLVAALLPRRVKRPRALSRSWLAEFVRRRRWAILVGCGSGDAGRHVGDAGSRPRSTSPAAAAEDAVGALQRDLEDRFGVDRDVALALTNGSRWTRAEDRPAVRNRTSGAVRPRFPWSERVGSCRSRTNRPKPDACLPIGCRRDHAIQARLRAVASEVGFRARRNRRVHRAAAATARSCAAIDVSGVRRSRSRRRHLAAMSLADRTGSRPSPTSKWPTLTTSRARRRGHIGRPGGDAHRNSGRQRRPRRAIWTQFVRALATGFGGRCSC